jgi:hypothetical protein
MGSFANVNMNKDTCSTVADQQFNHGMDYKMRVRKRTKAGEFPVRPFQCGPTGAIPPTAKQHFSCPESWYSDSLRGFGCPLESFPDSNLYCLLWWWQDFFCGPLFLLHILNLIRPPEGSLPCSEPPLPLDISYSQAGTPATSPMRNCPNGFTSPPTGPARSWAWVSPCSSASVAA